MNPIWHSHRRLNRLQSALLSLSMLGIAAMPGSLLLGETGAWLAAGVALMALLIEPTTSWALTLRLYRARPLHPAEAPGLWALLRQLAKLTGPRPRQQATIATLVFDNGVPPKNKKPSPTSGV